MSSGRARSRARERIVRMCDARLGPEELRREVIAELRPALGFNRWAWILTDPDSLVAHHGMAEIDFWPAMPRMAVLDQAGDVNSSFVLAGSRYPSAILSAATGGDLARSQRWDECLRPYGVGDVLTVACRDAHGCWGVLWLTRDSDDPWFGAAECDLLHDLSSTLGSGLRRAAVRPGPTLGDPPGPGVVMLDEDLTPESWTPLARAWLEAFRSGRPEADVDILPVVFHMIVGRVRSGSPARLRFRTAAGRWAVVDGAALEGAEAGRVAITIRAATPEEAVDLLGRTHGLTVRERQLVSLVLAGRDTRQLAEELSISSYTVKDHLKAVFDKIGVRSRRALVAGILGHGGEQDQYWH